MKELHYYWAKGTNNKCGAIVRAQPFDYYSSYSLTLVATSFSLGNLGIVREGLSAYQYTELTVYTRRQQCTSCLTGWAHNLVADSSSLIASFAISFWRLGGVVLRLQKCPLQTH